jgi:predicted dehydrogenase
VGNVAILVKGKNLRLEWDSENVQFTNASEANDLLHYEYRKGTVPRPKVFMYNPTPASQRPRGEKVFGRSRIMRNKKSVKNEMSRRQFLGVSATAAAGFTIVPRSVLGGAGYTAPSDMVNVAGIGVGGMGRSNVNGCKDIANIYALCDVDDNYAGKTFADYPKAKKYKDFRQMLDTEKEIDAVIIATPDHTHAAIAVYAMNLKKHVYCQKPLTRTIKEARILAEVAKKNNVVTQMGNQGHATKEARLINDWIADGAIGKVTEVHCFTNRPIWPQGDIKRPEAIPSVPASLDWDLWLGPAPFKHYHPEVCHFVWRGWQDYGTGALGDMGAHIFDHPFWALGLDAPTTIQASSTKYTEDAWPLAEIVEYEFPARGNKPALTLTWYDGGLMPPRPAGLEQGRMLGGRDGGGALFVGDKGMLMHGTYGSGPRLVPETSMREYQQKLKEEPIKNPTPESPGIHEEWIDAIKKGGKSTTDFSYSSKLTESMLLGNVAVLLKQKNMKLEWDSKNFQFTNSPEANDLLHYEYRKGWTLDGASS